MLVSIGKAETSGLFFVQSYVYCISFSIFTCNNVCMLDVLVDQYIVPGEFFFFWWKLLDSFENVSRSEAL